MVWSQGKESAVRDCRSADSHRCISSEQQSVLSWNMIELLSTGISYIMKEITSSLLNTRQTWRDEGKQRDKEKEREGEREREGGRRGRRDGESEDMLEIIKDRWGKCYQAEGFCIKSVLHHKNGRNRCELTDVFWKKSNKTNKQKLKKNKQVKIKSILFFSEAGRIYCHMIRS